MLGVFLCDSTLGFPTPTWKETGNIHIRLWKEGSEGSILLLLFLIKKSLE